MSIILNDIPVLGILHNKTLFKIEKMDICRKLNCGLTPISESDT